MFLIVASLVELPDAHDGLGALRWRAFPPSVL
jgi:aldehyde dehydrogenase (NAD+)